MSVGQRISELRKKIGISQYELSKCMDVSRQAVSKWESGRSSPDTVNLIRLADILNTDVEYLATGKHAPLSPSDRSGIHAQPEAQKAEMTEKVIEKTITVEKPVYIEVEKIIEVEKPVIRKVVRTKYLRNTLEYVLLGAACFALGLIIGLLL